MKPNRGLVVGDLVTTSDGRNGVLVENTFMNTIGFVGVDFTCAGFLNRAESWQVSDLTLHTPVEFINELADIIDPHPSTIMREWLDSLVQK